MDTDNHHGTCILLGSRAVLLRGPSGCGKSRLALHLLSACRGFARLVADDQVFLEPHNDRLIARPAPNLAGLLEVRGLGILPFNCELRAQVALVADLYNAENLGPVWPRLPEPGELTTQIAGLQLPFIAIDPCDPAVADRLALAMTRAANGVDNYRRGLAETDELVLSIGRHAIDRRQEWL